MARNDHRKKLREGLFENQKDQVKNAFLFTINRQIIILYKRYINLVEDLRLDHDIFLNKLEDVNAKKLDYFDEEKYNYIRKKILDLGNEAIREIDKFSDMVDVNFSEEKEKNGKRQKETQSQEK